MPEASIPLARMVAFLIASPLIHPVAVALLWSAIGMEYAVLYTVAALGISVAGGVLVAAWSRIAASTTSRSDASRPAPGGGQPAAGPGAGPPSGTSRERIARAFRRSWTDFRKLAWPLVLAVAVGALIHGYAPTDLLSRIAGPDVLWAVPAAALLGIPVYASILVLLPLGTTLLVKGVGIGAVTAFLMGWAGFSLPEGILGPAEGPAGPCPGGLLHRRRGHRPPLSVAYPLNAHSNRSEVKTMLKTKIENLVHSLLGWPVGDGSCSACGGPAASFTLRAAEPEDLENVERLLVGASLPTEALEDQFGKQYAVAVSTASGEVIGVAGYEVHSASGLLRSVAVDPAWRAGARERL